jgi:SAM-dependent methyltransferase
MGAFYPQDYMPHDLARRSNQRWLSRIDYRYGLTKRCRVLAKHRPPGRLLDVGCATGEFLARARELGWDAYGIDLSKSAVQYAREHWHLAVSRNELRDAPFLDGSFDAITLWNVFEHLFDPIESVEAMDRLLVPGGIVVMTVPNLDSIDHGLFGRWWSGYDVPRHLHVFSLPALHAVFAKRGFEMVDLRCLYGSYHAFMLSLRFYLREKGRSRLERVAASLSTSRALRVLAAPLFALIDRLGRGTIQTVVFRKQQPEKIEVEA